MRRDRRLATRLVGALLLLATLASCGAMPEAGPVPDVPPDGGGPTQESRVTVFALGPRPGAGPSAIVSGFLEALTSDDPGFSVARQYLTSDAVGQWDAGAGLTVLDSFDSTLYPEDNQISHAAQVTLSGVKVAQVGPDGAYAPTQQPAKETFSVVQTQGGQWRISDLPPGLVLTRLDFQRIYRPFNLYYIDSLDKDHGLVGDPVFLREGADIAAALARALVRGPTKRLAGAVDTAFPAGARLTSDDLPIRDGQIQVPLSDAAATASPGQRRSMSVQLTWTMAQLPGVTGAQAVVRGATIAYGTKSTLAAYDPSAGYGSVAYYQRGGRLWQVTTAAQPPAPAQPAPGPLGVAQQGGSPLSGWGAFAVSTDPRAPSVAAISGDGGRVTVAPLRDQGRVETWLSQPGLSSLSWDGLGELWALSRDRPGGTPQLWLLRSGQPPSRVAVADPEVRIDSFQVARDGVRVAAIVEAGGPAAQPGRPAGRQLRVGRIERSHDDTGAAVIADLAPVAPTLVDVASARWYGPDKLAVLGQQANGGLQPELFNADGSYETPVGAPQGNLLQIGASGADQPLIASTDQNGGTIWQLGQSSSGTANWTKLAEGGYPMYPG